MSAILLGGALAGVHAATFNFDLTGPAGSGLLPGNEVPTVVSTASGNEILTGFQYDDSSQVLSVNVGWGHSFGYGDLSSPFQKGTLNGPATQSQTASILYTFNTPGTDYNPQDGTAGQTGFISYNLALSPQGSYTVPQQEADLLAGKWYFNVASDLHTTGEIRGQLTAVPEPREYAMIAGLGLVGFACYRRVKSRASTAALA
jgi:hypothetical protein